MVILKTICHNVWQILISLDQFLTTLILSIIRPYERSYADEPLSCRANRARIKGKPFLAKIIDAVFLLFGDDNHCQESYENEKKRRQLPPELR